MSIFEAAKKGDIGAIENYLQVVGANVDAQDVLGNTALMLAVVFGQKAAVTVLLQHNADSNLPDKFGNTPAHAAAENNDLEILQLLDLHKAKLDATNTFGSSVLHSAAVGITTKAEKWELIEWLVKKLLTQKVDIARSDDDGVSVRDVFFEKDWSYAKHYDELLQTIGDQTPIETH